jgi:hypothetical protein
MRSAIPIQTSILSQPTNAFQKVCSDTFADVISNVRAISAFHLDNLQWHVEGYRDYDCWLLDDGDAGYALSKGQSKHIPGYRELINVFSIVSGEGNGDRIIEHVKEQSNRITLDCYDGALVDFYSSHGFQEFKRESNWNMRGPDVVYMRYNRNG